MAIITTRFTIGWFGTASEAGEDNCEPFNLTTQIGHYTNSNGAKTFQSGAAISSKYDEDAVGGLVVYGYTSSGAPQVWSLEKEYNAFWPNVAFLGELKNKPNRDSIVFTKEESSGDCILACGRMYVVINNNGVEVDIPGFIPSADGVDMGRIDTTIVG